MAERGGFEPPVGCDTYDDLANRCLQPLSHLSYKKIGAANQIRTGVTTLEEWGPTTER